MKRGKEKEKKAEEQAQGIREHGNKVLTQKRPRCTSLLVKALVVGTLPFQVSTTATCLSVAEPSLHPCFLKSFQLLQN